MGRQRTVRVDVRWILAPTIVEMGRGDVTEIATMRPRARGGEWKGMMGGWRAGSEIRIESRNLERKDGARTRLPPRVS